MLHCISTFLIALLQKYFSDCRVPSSIRFPPALVDVLLHASESFCCLSFCSAWARFAAQKLFWSIHPRWDEESFLFSSNKTRGSLEPCDALAVVWFSTRYCIHYYIVGLLACSKWDDGMHCHVFDRLDEPSPDLVDLVNASASLHVVCPMSLLCFVCAPHVPAW